MDKKYIDLELLDLDTILTHFGIDYVTEGKDVSKNFYGVECPFCPDGDHATHLGIRISNKKINCWRCGVKGTVIKYLNKVTGLSIKTILKRIKQNSDIISYIEDNTFNTNENRSLVVEMSKITYCQNELLKHHKEYLEERNFDPYYIFKKYKIQCIGPEGYYRNRIAIPFYHRNKLITFTTRDITGKAKIPYIHCPKELCPVTPKEYLYNVHTVKDIVVFVEGNTDVWRIGDGSVSTSGIEYTMEQLYLAHNVKRAFVLFDNEELAQQRAEQMAYDLSTFISDVNQIEFGLTDPAELTTNEIKSLRKYLFGKIYTF